MQCEDKAMQTRFSAKSFGIDLWQREAVINFYWNRVTDFKNRLHTIFEKSSDEQIGALNEFMNEAQDISDGSAYDLNADGIAREFSKLINNADVTRNYLLEKQQREQDELAEKDRKIAGYRDSVKKLKEELRQVRFSTKSDFTKLKIAHLYTIINQAQSISEKSQQELYEVGFAHEVASIMSGAHNMIHALDNDNSALDSDRVYVHSSSRAKREKENLSDIKRSKTY